jgi:hypothetical protein
MVMSVNHRWFGAAALNSRLTQVVVHWRSRYSVTAALRECTDQMRWTAQSRSTLGIRA